SRSAKGVRFLGLNVDFELAVTLLHFGLKIGSRRCDLDMLHSKFLADLDRDRLRVGLFTLLPENKCRADLQLLRDDCPESEDLRRLGRIVRFHGHGFYLSTGAIADVKCGRYLAFFSRFHFVLLSLCGRTTARCLNRLKFYRRLAGVQISEMAYGLFVVRLRMQLDFILIKLQFGACAKANGDRQDKSKDVCFHFL